MVATGVLMVRHFYFMFLCPSNSISKVEHVMDAHVAQALKKMSVEDFSHLLDVLAEGIGGSGLRVGQRERLIRLGKVMLHDAPQGRFDPKVKFACYRQTFTGTLRVIQNFATRCFNLFVDREEIYAGSSHLKMQYLEFIAGHCSDRVRIPWCDFRLVC